MPRARIEGEDGRTTEWRSTALPRYQRLTKRAEALIAAVYLAEEDIVRLILDGTVIRTRLDKKATNISVLAAIGVRRDGQKILLSIRHMGGESTAAWRQFLDDHDARGLRRPGA